MMATSIYGGTRVTQKDYQNMSRTCSAISGTVKRLRQNLADLDKEIKLDESGKFDFEKELTKLENRKADILKRMETNKAWADKYDCEVGPFMGRYQSMTGDIGTLYEKAKLGHESGLLILMREFGYHPEYKTPTSTFTAVPFKPK